MSDYQYEADASSSWPLPGSGEWRDDGCAPASSPRRSQTSGFDLPCLADALSRLGTVLWLERRERRPAHARVTIGAGGLVLFDHPALGVLGRCNAVTAHTSITPRGPREWLCFRDNAGDAQGKLYLLPDTDYLAWDEMNATRRISPQPEPTPRWHAHGAFLRSAIARLGTGWRGRLLSFELKRFPWLRTLGAHASLRISLLGLELARAIARDENAELVSPLNTY
jgi:hypothetical protein